MLQGKTDKNLTIASCSDGGLDNIDLDPKQSAGCGEDASATFVVVS